MTRFRPGLWLAGPTRFATLRRPGACIVAALLALMLVAAFGALRVQGPPPVSHDIAQRGTDQADVMLYESIVAGVRGGGDYYAVAAESLRAGDYPLRPFVTFRLPTLAVMQAALPDAASIGMLYLLAAAVLRAWFVRLRRVFARPPPLVIALVLVAAGMASVVQRDLVAFHEVWAGLLIALSLALRSPGRWTEAVALGMIAMLLRETAALYVAIMAVLALAERQRREAAGWAATLAVFAGVIALHAHAVGQVVRPLDPASPGWAGMPGFSFFVKTMMMTTALGLLPGWIAAPLVALALLGWAAWHDPLALRAVAIFSGYAVLLALFGRVDTVHWGMLVAPVFLLGLAFAPDALRDLAAAALDRRRIVVTRLVR